MELTSRSLSGSVSEHLGRQLRAMYVGLQEKPAFVGDPALPLEFDILLYRLATVNNDRARAQQNGINAVAAALGIH
jgi:hypothetical protein